MTVLLQLTTAGSDVGPFDLYSNLDGYVVPFETGVSKAALEAGYSSILVPDYSSVVRLKSTGVCKTSLNIILVNTTTTTSSTSSTTSTTTTGAPIPTCPDQVLVFQVCNSNAAMDDNFDVYINNIYVGALDLSTNTQVGSVFLATLDAALHVTSPDFVCPVENMVEYKFSPTVLVYGTNTIEMRNTQNNNNGNYGTIGIRSYQISGNDLINPCVIDDLTYNGESGASFSFDFSYTECCGTTTTTTTTETPTTTTTTTTAAPTTTTTTTAVLPYITFELDVEDSPNCHNSVTVTVNTTETVKVDITSSFTGGATYYALTPTPGSTGIYANVVDEEISANKSYDFGIDAHKTFTAGDTFTSTITLTVTDMLDDPIDSYTFTRVHDSAAHC